MSRAVVLACTLAMCALPPARALHAQAGSDWTVSVAMAASQEIAHSRNGATRTRLSGTVFGGEAVVTRGRLALHLRYGQGRVTNDTTARDVVEGEARLAFNVRPWLGLWVGPQARTFVAAGFSDRRWLFWSGGVTARGSLFPGRVESFVELWHGFSGRVNRPAAAASGTGVEAGLEVRIARPLWGRLAYHVEQGRVDGGSQETLESFTLTFGYVPVR